MAATIRNLYGFDAPIGDFASLTLDLTAQGRTSISGLVGSLSTGFTLDPLASNASTLSFIQTGGPDTVTLLGRFSGGSGRVREMGFFDDVTYTAGDPVAGEYYRFTGGNARYDADSGFSGAFNKLAFEDFSEGYSLTLSGKFFAATGAGSFQSADLQLGDGTGYRFRGDVHMDAGSASTFSGTLRSLDIYSDGGESIATARGLKIDAADFGDGLESFTDELIFAGNDNVTLGNWGVSFKAWDGNDRVRGGAWTDTIDGGNGHDILTGGFGSDVFRFSADSVVTSAYDQDQVTDFYTEVDTLSFDTDVFVALADSELRDPVTGEFLFSAAQAAGVLSYTRGVVYYDADGSAGAGSAVAIVKLAGVPTLGDANVVAESFGAI
jgi:hypothetical protein